MKKYIAYSILFLSTLLFVRTLPSFIHTFFLIFGIKVPIGIDFSSCETIYVSVVKNGFFENIFLISVLGICLGLIILIRTRNYNFLVEVNKTSFFLISFYIYFIITLVILVFHVWYIYASMIAWNLFDAHVFFSIVFLFALITLVIYIFFSVLVVADRELSLLYKYFYLLAIFVFSFEILGSFLGFISLYGSLDLLTNSISSFDNIVYSLGLGVFCLEDNNPCNKIFNDMNSHCQSVKTIQNMPPVRIPGRSKSISIAIRTWALFREVKHCKKAKNDYHDCMDNMFRSTNSSKRK